MANHIYHTYGSYGQWWSTPTSWFTPLPIPRLWGYWFEFQWSVLAESYGVDDDHSGKGRDRDAQENRKRFCKEYIEASYIQIHMFISFFSNSQFANARGLNFCLRPPKKSIPAAPDSETWNASCRQVSPSGAWRSWRANFLGEKSRESAWFRYNWMGLRIWAWLGP